MNKTNGRSFTKFKERLTESGLVDDVQTWAMRMGVSLRELYDGPIKAPSIVAARRSVYQRLLKSGKSVNEVARIFDRAPSGVLKLTRGK